MGINPEITLGNDRGRLTQRFILADYCLEPDTQLLSHQGQPVHLPRKPFQVLVHLVEHRDRFVNRTELLDRFWDGKDVYDDALRKCIGTIRKTLDDQSDQPQFIETRWGVGYRYVGPFEEQLIQPDTTITEISRTRGMKIVIEEEEINDALTNARRFASGNTSVLKPQLIAVAAFISLILVVGIVGAFLNSLRRQPPAAAPVPAPIRSLAVLPLKNVAGDTESEYFSDGVTENLINTLSRIEGLKVISRGSVFEFKGKDVDPRELKNKLRVGAILEGSVLKMDDRFRVNIRLVSTDNGEILWASNFYDRPLGDIFTIQDEIARRTAAGLRLELNKSDENRLVRQYTNNVDAYKDLLRGWYFWRQRTPSGLRKSIESYQSAIKNDPQCALAYAHLAGSYAMGVWYIPLEPREAMTNARNAAMKAIEIDPDLSEAHLAMSQVLSYEWDWTGAQREMERARELDPTFTSYGYAYHLMLSLGKPDEAVRWIKRSEELDPLSPMVSANVGQILYYARRYDEAIDQCRKTIEMDPNYAMTRTFLGQAYIQKGMFPEAIEELKKAVELSEHNPETIAVLGYVYAASGKNTEAEKVLAELIASSTQRYIPPYSIAEIYGVMRRNDEAFKWLEKAYEQRASHLVDLKVNPMLDPLRDDPRFADLLRRVRLS